MKGAARLVLVLMALALAAGCARPAPQGATPVRPDEAPVSGMPRPDHVVIVVEENRGFEQIIGSGDAPFINQLARDGALLTDSHGVAHPSQPNYLALFSGSTQGVKDDSCPHEFTGPNLASRLQEKGLTFGGYSESLPKAGFDGCQNGPYRRKHNPWVNFTNVAAAANMPITDFPTDFRRLPTVSFVVPDQNNDMHDGTIARADNWLKVHLADYAAWAKAHNSLLIVTWDEDEGILTTPNRIPTMFVGAGVKPGSYGGRTDHYDVLRTIEEMYGLTATSPGHAIKAIWQ